AMSPAARFAALVLSIAVAGSAVHAQVADGPAAAPALDPGALAAPLVDVTAPAGSPAVTVADRRGAGGLAVVFLSNACPYVLDWADRIPRLAAQAAERGVGLILVNSNAGKRRAMDSPEEMVRFAERYLGDLPYFLDEGARLADLLGAERTPEAFLFDADLRLAYRGPFDDHSGPFDRVTAHWLRDAVDAMVLGEVEAPESQPALGCKVQRPRRRAKRQ
ncbi:MAG: redoxin family protein, partial [Acidobacteriota bacterium]